jgi:hypothetical protein
LVISTSGANAEKYLAAGQPLAALVPGRLAEVVRLPETGRLEQFAASEAPITRRGSRASIVVPRLVDVQGKIEVYGGRQAADLPLVVRSMRGLGEITFVGVDLHERPLSEWSGRAAFLHALVRPYIGDDDSREAPRTLVTRGYNDLSGALRQRLGRTFQGVAPVSFFWVTVLALAYLLVLGPIDFFLVQRWFKRPLVGWVTFPLAVILFGGVALALADWRHGAGGRRVNQLELVDVDIISGQARGTIWGAVYSPDADLLDVRVDVEPELMGGSEAEVLLSSWALPGAGIGGTHAGGLDSSIGGDGYTYAAQLGGLEGVPVLTSGSKSLLARWVAPARPVFTAELVDDAGLVAGTITNSSGHRLRNVRLFYNEWAYAIGTVEDGAQVAIDDELSPRGVKTMTTQDALGATERLEGSVFVPERASVREIANVMMFYEAAGGLGFAQLPNQYQAYCDLSRAMTLGRAVLTADVETRGSRLVDSEGEAIGGEQSSAVIYRFLLPVRSE